MKSTSKKSASKKAPSKKSKAASKKSKAASKASPKKAVKKAAVKASKKSKASPKKAVPKKASTNKAVKPTKSVKKPSTIKASMQTAQVLTKKEKYWKPAVVETAMGKGLVHMVDREFKEVVKVKQGMVTVEKVVVHLVKDDLTPRTMNGNPKKALMREDSFRIAQPAYQDKPIKTYSKREPGEPSNKDFTKYTFDGKVYNKGRLIHAVVAKFVADNNPTIDQLRSAFPNDSIKAYGKGLFVPVAEAEKINTESKRPRFFSKQEDLIEINGEKIAITNQVDSGLVTRFLSSIPSSYKVSSSN